MANDHVHGRMHRESDHYWDGNWLRSPIMAHLGSFTVDLRAGLRIAGSGRFDRLWQIDEHLHGEAALTSSERSITRRCHPPRLDSGRD
jgi:hypothetical protein